MNKLRVLLVDDHALFREGLGMIISSQPDMEVIGEAGDGLEAAVKAAELHPDLILMDIQMPGMSGIEAVLKIKQQIPETTVVMLTVRDDDEKLFEAIKNGAQGYLLKSMHAAEITAMARRALEGEVAIPPHLAGKMLEEFRRLSKRAPQDETDYEELSARELEVLKLAAAGKTDKEIASTLSLSIHTVKTHLRNVLAKLHVRGRKEAARTAKKIGLFS